MERGSTFALEVIMRRALLRTRLSAGVGLVAAGGSAAAACHAASGEHHVHGEIASMRRRLERLEADSAARYGVKHTTGQNDAIFCWDEALTAAMPAHARAHEKDMHGGFTEDTTTGKVYTGIPGAGLFELSADLTTWRKLGDDPRLLSNIHGLVVFTHGSETSLALAQNDAERILICSLDGSVKSELTAPR